MRLRRLIPVACILCVSILCVSAPAFAQSWIEYTSLGDRFSVNFPGEPTVVDTTYTSQYEAQYPARVYTRVNGQSRYSITHIVDREAAAKGPTGFKFTKGMMFLFPISRKYLLAGKYEAGPDRMVQITADSVSKLNRNQMLRASTELYAPSKSDQLQAEFDEVVKTRPTGWTILRANIDLRSEVGPLTRPSQRTVEPILGAVLR